jgi:hypothetical protein
MGRRFIGGTFLASAAGFGLWLHLGGCHIDTSVTEPHRERDLRLVEIQNMARSGDFRQILEASKQIDKLEPADKLQILGWLADDPDPAVRLLSVKKLRTMNEPEARATLARLASKDPDPDVRSLAGEKPRE